MSVRGREAYLGDWQALMVKHFCKKKKKTDGFWPFIDFQQIFDMPSNSELLFKPFWTNVPLMDKSGSWFLLAKCLKNNCGRVTF